MLFYRAALPLSRQTLTFVSDLIRAHRRELGSVWRLLNPGQQAMVVLVYLRKGEPFAEVGAGFDVSTTTCWRYVEVTSHVAEVAYGILGLHCVRWDRGEVWNFLRWLMGLRVPGMPSLLPLALVEHVHPGVVDSLRVAPEETWTTEWCALLRSATPENLQRVDIAATAGYLTKVVPGAWARPYDRLDH